MKVQPNVRPDLVNAGTLACFASEPIDNGVFQLQCREMAVRKAIGVNRRVNHKRSVRREQVFPCKTGAHAVQVIGRLGLERRQIPQHAHRKTAVHADGVQNLGVPLKGKATPPLHDVGGTRSFQFFLSQGLEAREGFQIQVHPPLRLVV